MKEPEVKADKMENETHSKQFISVVNLKKNVKKWFTFLSIGKAKHTNKLN